MISITDLAAILVAGSEWATHVVESSNPQDVSTSRTGLRRVQTELSEQMANAIRSAGHVVIFWGLSSMVVHRGKNADAMAIFMHVTDTGEHVATLHTSSAPVLTLPSWGEANEDDCAHSFAYMAKMHEASSPAPLYGDAFASALQETFNCSLVAISPASADPTRSVLLERDGDTFECITECETQVPGLIEIMEVGRLRYTQRREMAEVFLSSAMWLHVDVLTKIMLHVYPPPEEEISE